jgi:DNA-binding response OmpR family regulator
MASIRTVLYVEDEEGDALFMRIAFKKAGMEEALQLVGDGRVALKYLSGVNGYGKRSQYPVPTVVLLDLNLPEMPGFEVLKWIRGHPDYAAMPVVVFTSSKREEDRVKARELGANEFVEKPMSAAKFGDVAERLRERWLDSAAA